MESFSFVFYTGPSVVSITDLITRHTDIRNMKNVCPNRFIDNFLSLSLFLSSDYIFTMRFLISSIVIDKWDMVGVIGCTLCWIFLCFSAYWRFATDGQTKSISRSELIGMEKSSTKALTTTVTSKLVKRLFGSVGNQTAKLNRRIASA